MDFCAGERHKNGEWVTNPMDPSPSELLGPTFGSFVTAPGDRSRRLQTVDLGYIIRVRDVAPNLTPRLTHVSRLTLVAPYLLCTMIYKDPRRFCDSR